jgi:hypothetical protein
VDDLVERIAQLDEAGVVVTQSSLATARDAYMFTCPLVMSYRTMYMQAMKR